MLRVEKSRKHVSVSTFELWLRHFVVRLFCDVWNICFFAKLLEQLEGFFFYFLILLPLVERIEANLIKLTEEEKN